MAERVSRQQGREFENELLLGLLNRSMGDQTFREGLGQMATPAPEGLARLGPDPNSMTGIGLDIMNLDPSLLQDPSLLESLRSQDVLAGAGIPETRAVTRPGTTDVPTRLAPESESPVRSGVGKFVVTRMMNDRGQIIKAKTKQEFDQLVAAGYRPEGR